MKIDRSKLKKSSSEVPADCKNLIDLLTSTGSKGEFLQQLQRIETWTCGKCELLHWIDVLDVCDDVLELAAARVPIPGRSDGRLGWALSCDGADDRLKELLLWTLHFTTLLIEHSFSRHLYSSMEHLTTLLSSSDLDVVLAVLNLLYMFSKRSQFISRLSAEKRQALLSRLTHLAASWGGKENGFGLAKCCTDLPIYNFPESATTLHFEFYNTDSQQQQQEPPKNQKATVIHLEHVDRLPGSPATLMDRLIDTFNVPESKRMLLFTYLRLAASFSSYEKRLKCVQARLQSLSVLIYSNQLTDNIQTLLYSGLLEELVEVLEMSGERLMEIKAASLKSLTSIIHLDRNPNFPKLNTIIDVTGASQYHGFLPVLVRTCITSLTSSAAGLAAGSFPQPLATALFSFLYHLASYEAGGEALVSCGMMESLLKVIQWPSTELDHITFVTRAVRVIDLITNLDMHSFQTHSGLASFITRLGLEVDHCRKQQPFEIRVGSARRDSVTEALESEGATSAGTGGEGEPMEVDQEERVVAGPSSEPSVSIPVDQDFSAAKNGMTCLPQRAALLRSMLNFLKKAISDPAFTDSIRHVMEGSLPSSLKHIISNAEYYGASLFLLATDVVTAYVFQEPSLLSSLQDNGLTDVVLQALLVKDVPATREVLGSLPNVFSALCLNTRGLNAFVACKPFERLFKVLLSPDYLPAMRRRRSSDPMGDTASNLGIAMDELMRHQPSLKQAATSAIIKLLEEVCVLGNDPKNVCLKVARQEQANPPAREQPANVETGSSDEEEEEEEEQSNQAADQQTASTTSTAAIPQVPSTASVVTSAEEGAGNTEKEPVPLVDYIHNVMKFVDAILSNNSTDDHCREFVKQKGLVPLMGILGLPNLPIDFPAHTACQSVAAVAKSVLNLAHEPQVLKEGLGHLDEVLKKLEPLHRPLEEPGGSVLLHELVSAPNLSEATSNPQVTPLLHHMSAAHAYITMFVHVCRTGQQDIRTISVSHWGSELGLRVLKGLSQLYTSLVWESTVLLALCSEDTLPPGCEFGKADMEKLLPPSSSGEAKQDEAAPKTATATENGGTLSPSSGTSADSNSSVTMAMENLSTEPDGIMNMDVNAASDTGGEGKKEHKPNPVLHYQIKQIKPLLSGSSRLGRSLAELFALLVKLCVGSPLRQRRGQQIPPIPALPSPPARNVAASLTKLLASGLSWEPPSTSPIPRFRLTFYICSVGFTTPMLFDEKKFPYHLMLMKFMHSGGQKAFFETFRWALSMGGKVPLSKALERPKLPEGTGEFLDAWLVLLEKMVNPKSVLESPHNMPSKASGSFKPFDPIKYLMRTHRLAFEAIMYLWDKKPVPVYGRKMSESILLILCHILKGEKLIAEKLEKEKSPQLEPVAGPSSSLLNMSDSGNVIAASLRASGAMAVGMQSHLAAEIERAIQDNSGPSDPPAAPSEPAEPSADAPAEASPSTAAAAAEPAEPAESAEPPVEPPAEPEPEEVDQESLTRLMDMGFPRERCVEALRNTTTLDQATDYLLTNPLASARQAPASLDGLVGIPLVSRVLGEQDELMRAIAMSLGNPVGAPEESKSEKTKNEEEVEETLPEEDFIPLSKETIDDFTNRALSGCLNLLDTLPETIYRVCDLLLAVFQRNGGDFKQNVLRKLIDEVQNSVNILTKGADEDEEKGSLLSTNLIDGKEATRAAARIHLFTLLFEDCKILCAKIVEETKILSSMTLLLAKLKRNIRIIPSLDEFVSQFTPKWLTPMLLFIDLHEKVVLGMNRRAALTLVCSHTWKWFDLSSGKWCSYAQPNSKTIDDAFWAGESSVRITNGRRKYTIQFGSMMQANEETGNRRPVMISVLDPKSRKRGEAEELSESEPGKSDAGAAETTAPKTEESRRVMPEGSGLSAEERMTLLGACVALMRVPVDADALNAVLRLCLRFTQDYECATEFIVRGGVGMLLNLTQASSFSGFTSLATLLIRHTLEDPQTLRHTMEKVIRASTINSNSYTTKELHYLLRILAPAACRAPELFSEVSREVLRVDISLLKRGGPEDDQRLLVKSLPMKTNATFPIDQSLDDVSNSVICDLLNFLITEDDDVETTPDACTSGAAAVSGDQSKDAAIPAPSPALTPAAPAAPAAAADSEEEKGAAKKKEAKESDGEKMEKHKRRPLLNKGAVCRLLAELVKSYGNCAKLITEHIYEVGTTDLIEEETTALAFLLDEMLISKDEKDCTQHVKTLIAALASSNHYPDAQTMLVWEMKGALSRALAFPESQLKHTKIQALAGLICTMIESCPTSQHQNITYKNQPFNMNNIVKMMLKRGLITDLARVPHSLDLSGPNVAVTVNAVLKPLEILSRIVNQPQAVGAGSRTNKPKGSEEAPIPAATNSAGASGTNATVANGNGTNTTNSEATRAQGDETVEPDPEATEHDVSTAAESNSESQLQTVGEGNDEEFEEMMDQLLERDNPGVADAIVVEAIEQQIGPVVDSMVDDTHHDSQMISQDESRFESQQMSQDEEDRESESGRSDATTEENDDGMEEDGDEEDEDEVEEEEDDDEEEDGDDDDDDDEDDEVSIFDEENDELRGLGEDPFYRYHLGDNGDRGDGDLIFHRPFGADPHHLHGESSGVTRAIHLPLWSDMNGAGVGTGVNSENLASVIGGGAAGAGAGGGNSHVTPNHPMLMGRQTGVADASANASRITGGNRTLLRHRGFRGYVNLSSRGQNNPAPAQLLRNFLGQNPRGLITQGLRNGTPVLVDFGFAILDSLDNEIPDLGEGGLGGGGRAALSTIPSALVRWNEESRVIDGDSMHDKVTKLKPEILEVVERVRDEELAERKTKKKKQQEEEEAKKKAAESAKKAERETPASPAAEQPLPSGSAEDLSAAPEPPAFFTIAPPTSSSETPSISTTAAMVADELAAAISSRVTNYETNAVSSATTTPADAPEPAQPGSGSGTPQTWEPMNMVNVEQLLPPPPPPPAPNPEPAPAPEDPQPTEPAAEEPVAGPSGSAAAESRDDYSSILGINVSELPEGVDPSFLAALPEDMRQEVIEEQRRLQNIRRRAEQNTEAGVSEVNPEFLAALPPSIQEEVLAQQRMEQQRQAATVANPEEPVDPGEFLQTLPAQLRQAVLADMEDSQISSLPAEYAAEAQNLRGEIEQRNRAMMQGGFFNQFSHNGSALSSILRSSAGRSQHILGSLGRDSHWRTNHFGRASSLSHPSSLFSSATSSSLRFNSRGRQLLDHEGLSCLLVLLFIDDAKINTARLHRILRNLCYHSPTGEWLVKSLLSILDKSNAATQPDNSIRETPPTKIRKSATKGTEASTVKNSEVKSPSWLNVSMDAALGFRANVFQINRQNIATGKKSWPAMETKTSISIHSGASAVVSRHALEVLITLAKSFSAFFLPRKDPKSADVKVPTSSSSKLPPSAVASTPKPEKKIPEAPNDFWEILLRLDLQSTSKKGKGIARSHSNVSSLKSESGSDEDSSSDKFETSPFGVLLGMLSSPVIRRSSVLTDKLLRLLSLISVGQSQAFPAQEGEKKQELVIQDSIGPDHLKLAVEVLTSKSCSEEGLEDVTALLSNLSFGPEPTRDTILKLLLQGAQELGNVVRQNVLDLQAELQHLKTDRGDQEEAPESDSKVKGAITDRFTKDKVILTAPTKVKAGAELQLSSMNALTSKTSSQSFFLRVLKVIIQLREAALVSMKKAKKKKTDAKADEDKMGVDEDGEEVPDSLESLSEQLDLTGLWDTLSLCLQDLADTPDHHAVLVLQASVEAFFLVHAAPIQPDDKKKTQQKETRQEQLAHIQEIQEQIPGVSAGDKKPEEPQSAVAIEGSSKVQEELSHDTKKFLKFAETHRTVLNQILRQSTTHLADGPFFVLVDHTRVLDFDIKRRYFRTELERMDEGMRREDLAVHVRRENVFEDSFRELHRRTPEEWKNRFYIVFEGEEGQDAGGLLREWYVIISREIFNPMYALFKVSPGDKVTYTIYEQSQTNPNHLDYFKFVGRVIAKAIYDNKLLECYFSRSFYKHILAKHVKYTDMESEDYAFYKGLEFLTQNKVEDLGYDLTFSTEIREFGVTEVRDMIPNGRNIPVTEENKMDYIRLVCQTKMTGAIRKQLSAFLEGFYNIIPRRLISIFNEQELELLLSGLPTIDIDDLKANTEYHKYQANSLQIVWFWRALRTFDQTDKAKFLQFVTGSSKVPLQGFSALEGMNGAQKFQIHKDDRSTDRLPSAHTCFNQLDLPAYETYDKLRTYLLKAIHECSEGFGFA